MRNCGRRATMGRVHPSGFEPMLATASSMLKGEGWAYEAKLDGWRALVHVGERSVRVYSRPGREISASVPQLAAVAGVLPPGTVLDGELVVGSGRAATFYRLSPELSRSGAAVTFAAFDLLALEGRSLIQTSYEERRRLLVELAFVGPAWCSLPAWTGVDISDLLAACEFEGVEGLVAKRLASRYRPGRRSGDWVKVKTVSWKREHGPFRMARR